MPDRLPLIDDPERMRLLARQNGETAAMNGQPRTPPFYTAEMRTIWLDGYDGQLARQPKPTTESSTKPQPPRGAARVEAWVQSVRDKLRALTR